MEQTKWEGKEGGNLGGGSCESTGESLVFHLGPGGTKIFDFKGLALKSHFGLFYCVFRFL